MTLTGFLFIAVVLGPVVWGGARLGLFVTRRWDHSRVILAATLTLYATGLTVLLGTAG